MKRVAGPYPPQREQNGGRYLRIQGVPSWT
jgi:hypothetical protein